MDVALSLAALREKQEKALQDVDRLIREVQGLDLLKTNEELRKEVEQSNSRITELEKQYRQTADENMQLRFNLQEQMLDEKFSMIRSSRAKLDAYFSDASVQHGNRLDAAEAVAMGRVSELKRLAASDADAMIADIMRNLSAYENTLKQMIFDSRARFNAAMQGPVQDFGRQVDTLAAEPLSQEMIQKRIRQNEMEMKIGLSWVNKLGILLILFGVGTAAKYTYSTWFTDAMRAAAIFALGGLLMAAGEWFYRKRSEKFAVGLIGGGLAVIFSGIFYSHFFMKIIGLETGLILAVLTTTAAVTLSVRYRSQTICALGLIGGYLPFFSYAAAFGLRGEAYYSAMGYLFLLNFAVMAVSFRQRWSRINYISMALHVPSLLYLVSGAAIKWIAIIYATASFGTYLVMILAYPLKYRQKLNALDVLLLGVNTTFSCAILYVLFRQAGWQNYHGLLALGFCLTYTALARWVRNNVPEDKYASGLFHATALTFAILMIPFQFGVQWTSMGLLVEGVLLSFYGMKKNEMRLERAGNLLFGLCVVSFFAVDWLRLWPVQGSSRFFDQKYLLVIAGMVWMSRLYLADLAKNGPGRYGVGWEKIHLFKYFTILNVWGYLIYVSGRILSEVLPQGHNFGFYRLILIAGATMVMAYSLPRIALVRDKVVSTISLIFYAVAVLLVLLINATIPVIKNLAAGSSAEYVALSILVAYNAVILGAVRELAMQVIIRRNVSLEFYPLAILLFGLGNVTVFLIAQFNLGSTNLIFSLIYLLAGMGSIIYGFRRKYVLVRRVGLGLALLATTKLFIYDLYFLTSLNKIAAYFCFGFVLLGISYMYQRLNQSGQHEKQKTQENG